LDARLGVVVCNRPAARLQPASNFKRYRELAGTKYGFRRPITYHCPVCNPNFHMQ